MSEGTVFERSGGNVTLDSSRPAVDPRAGSKAVVSRPARARAGTETVSIPAEQAGVNAKYQRRHQYLEPRKGAKPGADFFRAANMTVFELEQDTIIPREMVLEFSVTNTSGADAMTLANVQRWIVVEEKAENGSIQVASSEPFMGWIMESMSVEDEERSAMSAVTGTTAGVLGMTLAAGDVKRVFIKLRSNHANMVDAYPIVPGVMKDKKYQIVVRTVAGGVLSAGPATVADLSLVDDTMRLRLTGRDLSTAAQTQVDRVFSGARTPPSARFYQWLRWDGTVTLTGDKETVIDPLLPVCRIGAVCLWVGISETAEPDDCTELRNTWLGDNSTFDLRDTETRSLTGKPLTFATVKHTMLPQMARSMAYLIGDGVEPAAGDNNPYNALLIPLSGGNPIDQEDTGIQTQGVIQWVQSNRVVIKPDADFGAASSRRVTLFFQVPHEVVRKDGVHGARSVIHHVK